MDKKIIIIIIIKKISVRTKSRQEALFVYAFLAFLNTFLSLFCTAAASSVMVSHLCSLYREIELIDNDKNEF